MNTLDGLKEEEEEEEEEEEVKMKNGFLVIKW